MVSGQWSVVSGQWWSVVSGQWSVVSGQWSVVSGQWSVVSGQWSVVRGWVVGGLRNGRDRLLGGPTLSATEEAGDGRFLWRFALWGGRPGSPALPGFRRLQPMDVWVFICCSGG
ncbi:MAG: hypothetical protein EAZ82_12345 [Verrucomicrobia bacterium]|nr:MAG: hypothetical protein EAZ82_12345 [Verrucomicrobiota bacterium]